MHLTSKSQAAVEAAIKEIPYEQIFESRGKCSIGVALDLVLFSATKQQYFHVSVPATAEVRFWNENDTSIYGKTSATPRFSHGNYTIFGENYSFQLTCNTRRVEPYLFKAHGRINRVELADAVPV